MKPSLIPTPEMPHVPVVKADVNRPRGAVAAILTDIHFWIPMVVLAAGTVLLLSLS